MQERHPLREQEPKAPEAVRSNAKKPSDASGVTVREGGPPALQQAPDPSAASKDKAGEPVSEHRGGLAQKIQATSLSAPGGAGQSGKDQSVLGELNANARTASKAGDGSAPAAQPATGSVAGSRSATQLPGPPQLAQSQNVAAKPDVSAKASAATNDGVIQAAVRDSVQKYGDPVDKREHPAAQTKAVETNGEHPTGRASGQSVSQESGRNSGGTEEKNGRVLWFGKGTEHPQELARKEVAARNPAQVAASDQGKAKATANADGTMAPEGLQGWRYYAAMTGITPRETIRAAAEQVVARTQTEVVEQARYLQQGGKSQLTINLDPPELGRIRLEIELQEGQLKVKMGVENPKLREALREDMQSLERALKGGQVDVGTLDVSDYQSGRQDAGRGGLDETGWPDSQEYDNSEQTQPTADAPRTWTLITDSGRVDCLV